MLSPPSKSAKPAPPRTRQGDLPPWPLLVLLMVICGFGALGMNTFVPAVPKLALVLDTDPATVQLTISLYLFAFGGAQLVLGLMADRFGRRPVLVGGLALATVATGLAIYATSIEQLIVARVLQGIGSAAGPVIGRIMVRDLTKSRESAASLIGLVTTAMVVAPMVAPLLGGVIDTLLGWVAIFVFLTLVNALVLVWVVVSLPETRPQNIAGGRSDLLANIRALGGSVPFVCYAIAGPLSCAGFYVLLGGGPHLVETLLGLSSAEYGLWAALPAVGYMAGNAMCSRYAVRYGIERLIRWGIVTLVASSVLMLVCFLVLPKEPRIVAAAYFLPLLVNNIGNGLVFPNAIAAGVSLRPQAVGLATGIIGFAQMGSGALIAQHTTAVTAQATSAWPLGVLTLIYAVVTALPIVALAFWSRGKGPAEGLRRSELA